MARPSIDTSATHFAGTPVSGPLASAESGPVTATASWMVQVRWVALLKWPAVASISLGARTTLLIAGRSSAPLLGSPKLTGQVQLVEASATQFLTKTVSRAGPAEALPLGTFTSALPPGVTAVFDATVAEADPLTPGETLQLRLSVATPALSAPVLMHNALTVHQQQVETAFFDQTVTPAAGGFALLQRLPSASPGGPVLAAMVEVRPATASPADQAALARCLVDLQQSARRLAAQSTLFPLEISAPAGITSALNSLTDPPQQRASLTYLADRTDAPLCTDVALVADNATLADLARRVQRATHRLPAGGSYSAAALGWAMDHAAFDLLSGFADSAEGGKLTPELAAVLTQFCGEAARHTAALDEVGHGVTGQADLHNRLVAQNLLFLSDPSPAARVRAFDWLNSRHLAPTAFDPLGSARKRRRAMDRAATQP